MWTRFVYKLDLQIACNGMENEWTPLTRRCYESPIRVLSCLMQWWQSFQSSMARSFPWQQFTRILCHKFDFFCGMAQVQSAKSALGLVFLVDWSISFCTIIISRLVLALMFRFVICSRTILCLRLTLSSLQLPRNSLTLCLLLPILIAVIHLCNYSNLSPLLRSANFLQSFHLNLVV